MLRDDINNAVKEAMKAKDERKLSTLRMVNSTIKNADIDARGQGKPPLSDADLLALDDLTKLWRLDLAGRALAATRDRAVPASASSTYSPGGNFANR